MASVRPSTLCFVSSPLHTQTTLPLHPGVPRLFHHTSILPPVTPYTNHTQTIHPFPRLLLHTQTIHKPSIHSSACYSIHKPYTNHPSIPPPVTPYTNYTSTSSRTHACLGKPSSHGTDRCPSFKPFSRLCLVMGTPTRASKSRGGRNWGKRYKPCEYVQKCVYVLVWVCLFTCVRVCVCVCVCVCVQELVQSCEYMCGINSVYGVSGDPKANIRQQGWQIKSSGPFRCGYGCVVDE